MKLSLKNSKGFTLIEILVSIALFGFVMLATTSTLLSLVDANHKAQSTKTAIDNLSLALESMTRNIRTGTQYNYAGGHHCSSTSGGSTDGYTGISLKDQKGNDLSYSWVEGSDDIKKTLNSNTFTITSPEITIDRLCFYIAGTSATDGTGEEQPIVSVTIGGVVNNTIAAGAKQKTVSRFDIQTLVSQRVLDI
ncbi:MAG: type II secretion system protein [Patescibacteria group bacterium]